MQIQTLTGIPTETILKAFNQSFSDYFVPLQLTHDQLTTKLKADNVNLDLSVGAFENDHLIGFILHGTDHVNGKNIVYNGGTGVIPEKRGNGLTKAMYDIILPKIRKQQFDTMVLEVISNNTAAIKSYQKAGYKVKRKLTCYKGEISITSINQSVTIKPIPDYNWTTLQSFWDFKPTWQNSIQSIERLLDNFECIGAYFNGQLVGYLVYNPGSKRIIQIAVDKTYRRQKIGFRLLAYISKVHNTTIGAINIDESSESANTFLQNAGLENILTQLEMELKLT